MSVYVDDMLMQADVPNGGRTVRGRWSHLIADTQEELHDFAARLGLRRSWFQEPKGFGSLPLKPESLKAQQWHYDVTGPKREQAIKMGAIRTGEQTPRRCDRCGYLNAGLTPSAERVARAVLATVSLDQIRADEIEEAKSDG
jgi:hypothetical protein